MKDKLVTFKDLELAAKSYYGEGAELEIVEPVVLLPYKGGMVEEVKSFDGAAALIFHRKRTPYSPDKDSIDLVKDAQNNGELVVFIPEDDTKFLGNDSTVREWNRVCVKYQSSIFVIPHLVMSSVRNETLSEKILKKNNNHRDMKAILKLIEDSRTSEPGRED